MKMEPLNEFESQLAANRTGGAPTALRSAVLNDVERELRAGRWDRRLMRAAVLLLVVGVGFNAALVFKDVHGSREHVEALAATRSRDALLETAVVVSESTDPETGRRFALQLAAFSGRVLTAQEIETLESLTTKDRG